MKTRIVLVLTAIAQSLNMPALQAASVGQAMLNQTDRIVVRYHPKPTEANALAFIKQGMTRGSFGVASGKRKDVLDIGESLSLNDVKMLADALADDPQVAYAEPDYIMQTMRVPSDSRYNEQWHYFERTGGINLPAAWDITTGSSDVVVAVVDTGVRSHPDIVSKLLPGYDFIKNINRAHDGDARDPDPSDPGDAINAGSCSSPGQPLIPSEDENSSWHGTHVAGTIAATTDNNEGVAGVSWGAKILPLRVLGLCGGYSSDIIDAMRWAAGFRVYGVPANTNPAKVINLSLGGSHRCSRSYQDAINEITKAGVTIVVAAGNNAENSASTQPANCNNVISVAATNRQGTLSYYSNFGQLVDISAPGGSFYATASSGVLSLSNSGTDDPVSSTYKYLQGTSMAAPHVSGVISLMLSLRPGLSPARIEELIKANARAFPAGSTCQTTQCGSGIIDAAAILQAVKNAPM